MEDRPDETPHSAQNGEDLNPGRVIASYIIGDRIATGGVGRIYRAWDTRLNRSVAIKILAGAQALDEDQVSRFRREVAILAKLSHPAIVRVLDAGEFDGRPFFAMELVHGLNLEEHILRHPSPPQEIVAWIRHVATGIVHLHREGLVHRDIKPSNILLRADGNVTLVDFGLAQTIDESDSDLTQTGVSLGTPAFMAPEQAKGERDKIDHRTDVYQLGATLFALLAGRPPQIADSPHQMMMKVADARGPEWRGVVVSKPLRAIITQAMAKQPHHRYDSVAAMDADLARWQAGEWVRARRDPLGRALNFFFRRLALPILILALGAAMTIAVVMVEDREENEVYSPISLEHEGEGLRRHAVGGVPTVNAPNLIRRIGPSKNQWIGVSAGGRLSWGDAANPEHEKPLRAQPEDALAIALARGDFRASFGVERAIGEPVVCFLGSPWHSPKAGMAYEIDWRNARLRGYRRGALVLDVEWRALVNAQQVSLSVERHARRIEITGRTGEAQAPSLAIEFLDGPTSRFAASVASKISDADLQLGVVSEGKEIVVTELTYQQLSESKNFAENLYAYGVYEMALESIDARLGVLGSKDIGAEELRHLHFMRGECLRSQANPSDDALSDALKDFQFVVNGANDLETFYAQIAIFEIQMGRELARATASGDAIRIPESLDMRIRAMTSGDPLRASIYALRLLALARSLVPADETNALVTASRYQALFQLVENASTTVYLDNNFRLALHRDFMNELFAEVASANTGAAALSPALMAAYVEHCDFLCRLGPIRRWGDQGSAFFRYLWMETDNRAEVIKVLRIEAGELDLSQANATEVRTLHLELLRRETMAELSQGKIALDSLRLLAISQTLLERKAIPSRELYELELVFDLFGGNATEAAAAELALRKEVRGLADGALLHFESASNWLNLLEVVRYRLLPDQSLYALSLADWVEKRADTVSQSPWIDGFLLAEFERLSK